MSDAAEHVADLADDHVHNLLDAHTAARVERHCAGCEVCRAAVEAARRRLTALRAVPPVEAGAPLVRATADAVNERAARDRRRARRFLWGSVAAVAASVAVLAGLHWYFATRQPTPYELTVLGQRDILAGTMVSLRVRLTDHRTGLPLADVPVRVALVARGGERVEVASLKTDQFGGAEPRFRVPDWPDGEAELLVTADTEKRPEVLTQPVRLKRSWQLMLSTDKPVYKPGQPIRLRALALRQPDLKPVAGQAATFTVSDPKGNVIFKHTAPTSPYGLAGSVVKNGQVENVECLLADECMEGTYAVACNVGDSESRLNVEVQRYVLPKFKLDLTADKSFYAPGEKVKLTVQADYFFGKPVAGAEVEVQLGPARAQPLKARTDEKGAVELTDPLGAFQGTRTYAVTVTDTAGQKQTASLQRLVTNQPLNLEVLPEGGALVQGVPNVVYILATRPDASPASDIRLTVTGVDGDLRPDANGAASFTITPQGREAVWTVRARAADGKLLTERRDQITCGEPDDDFLVRPDRAVYRGGETMTLTALGAGELPVFVDLVKDGRDKLTLLAQTIPMSGGSGKVAVDLPPDLSGAVRLCAYRLDPKKPALCKWRTVYVQPASALAIKTTFDRRWWQSPYRPGGKATLNFALTGADGRPAVGALSLAAVDEAVFAVLTQRPGQERSFFTLPPEVAAKVQPWAPGGAGGLFAQALFARAALAPPTFGEPFPAQKRIAPPPNLGETHSLSAESYRDKDTEVLERRDKALSWVWRGWIALLCLVLVGAYVGAWLVGPTVDLVRLHAVVLAFLGVGVGLVLLFVVVRSKDDTSRYAGTQVGLAVDEGRSMAKEAGGAPGGGRWDRPAMEADRARFDGGEGAADMRLGDPRQAPGAGEPAPRLRQHFPETLLWRPELVTDAAGRASLDLELADSITAWRLSVSAVAGDGRLGGAERALKVFQPFFVDFDLPVSFTRNDEAAVPVVVSNYLDREQTVTLTLADSPGFERITDAEQKVTLRPGEVKAVRYRLKAKAAGEHALEIKAVGSGASDAVKRMTEIVPDGQRVEATHNGALQHPADLALDVPAEAIDGSVKAVVKIYPSSFSQLLEGLEGIFRMPSGCFEQTSSTTYPNVLALDYMKRHNIASPKVEAKAHHYVHVGYQRLLGFEVPGGGFEWFGHPPANVALTAYGLMEFQDMAKVHNVDPQVIRRTRAWLLSRRGPDGCWSPDGRHLHEEVARGADAVMARVALTAYVAWAVFSSSQEEAGPTLAFLKSYEPRDFDDPHVLALMCNALLALDPSGAAARPYLDRLAARKTSVEDGRYVFWAQPENGRTLFHGAGAGGRVETTALAALALLKAEAHRGTAHAALAWLATQKGPYGTWPSTQATVLSLKALLEGTSKPLGGDGRRVVEVKLDDTVTQEIAIPADQAEVMHTLDLTKRMGKGPHRLVLTEKTKTGAGYQVAFRYHVPAPKAPPPEWFEVGLKYQKDGREVRPDEGLTLNLGEVVTATATVRLVKAGAAPMVMVELPVPLGLSAEAPADDFKAALNAGRIVRYEAKPGRLLVYLTELRDAPLTLTYRLRATLPAQTQAAGARAWEYYAPEREGRSAGARVTVRGE
jgi:hypothetical protein